MTCWRHYKLIVIAYISNSMALHNTSNKILLNYRQYVNLKRKPSCSFCMQSSLWFPPGTWSRKGGNDLRLALGFYAANRDGNSLIPPWYNNIEYIYRIVVVNMHMSMCIYIYILWLDHEVMVCAVCLLYSYIYTFICSVFAYSYVYNSILY